MFYYLHQQQHNFLEDVHRSAIEQNQVSARPSPGARTAVSQADERGGAKRDVHAAIFNAKIAPHKRGRLDV
jgi:hypothetical protein